MPGSWRLPVFGLWCFTSGFRSDSGACGWFGPWLIVGAVNLWPSLQASGPGVHHSVLAKLVFEGIVVGATEERLFRGLIQTTLNHVIGGRGLAGRIRWGTAIASAVSGLAHLSHLPHQSVGYTLGQVAYATVIGVVIGHFYDDDRSRAPVAGAITPCGPGMAGAPPRVG